MVKGSIPTGGDDDYEMIQESFPIGRLSSEGMKDRGFEQIVFGVEQERFFIESMMACGF